MSSQEEVAESTPVPPHLLCGHNQGIIRAGYRLRCRACGSFWDRESCKQQYHYDDSYPQFRQHLNPKIGELKVATLVRWLEQNGIDIKNMRVCEVGFGGAHCLRYLHTHAAWAGGIEVVEANFQQALQLGIPKENLFDGTKLPQTLSQPIDLWIFQDSFEHLPGPSTFLSWLTTNSSPKAAILLVAPRAGSLSERALGRFWPHKLPDHTFHWSIKGLGEFLERYGFVCERRFYPLKYVSLSMLVKHIAHKLGCKSLAAKIEQLLPSKRFLFNFGEMGLLLTRQKSV